MATILHGGDPIHRASPGEPRIIDLQSYCLPAVEQEGMRLSGLLTREREMHLLLEVQTPPGVPSIMYPLAPYAMIAEFRAMLVHPFTSHPRDSWAGHYFYGHSAGSGPDLYYWRGHPHGITVCVTAAQWAHMCEVFDTAFATPEYEIVWTRLAAQYGGR